tara:strand:+ start:1081 stop:1788 length:708 start_codon:yes stop_codon:yes gene_type:complete
MKLSIIIPLFNEKNTIVKLLKRIEDQRYIKKQIIIVNDCSTDTSLELINSYNFLSENLILNHNVNLGKGACIQTAKNYINGDIVIIQDADLEYDPNDYKKLITPILNNVSKIVYGSRVLGKKRYHNAKNFISRSRIFFNHFLTQLSNIINRQNLTDAHTCYKVFAKDIFLNLQLREKGFSFCPEVNSKVARLNLKIEEVEINYNGRTYLEGKKISLFDGVYAILSLIRYGLLKLD